jgi:hypothetical protein
VAHAHGVRITVGDVRASKTQAGRVERREAQLAAFVRTDCQRQFLTQQIAAIGLGVLEGAAQREPVAPLGIHAVATQEIKGGVGKQLRR